MSKVDFWHKSVKKLLNLLKFVTASRVGVVCTMNKDFRAWPLCACSCFGFKNDIMSGVAFWAREVWINTILQITYRMQNGTIFSLKNSDKICDIFLVFGHQ